MIWFESKFANSLALTRFSRWLWGVMGHPELTQRSHAAHRCPALLGRQQAPSCCRREAREAEPFPAARRYPCCLQAIISSGRVPGHTCWLWKYTSRKKMSNSFRNIRCISHRTCKPFMSTRSRRWLCEFWCVSRR